MMDWQYIFDVVSTVALIAALCVGWGFGMVWLFRFIRDY